MPDSGTPEVKADGAGGEKKEAQGASPVTREEVKALINEAVEAGRKAGQAQSHGHFQSVKDKEVDAVRKEHAPLADENRKLREALYSKLSPEERLRADHEELLEAIKHRGSQRDVPDSGAGSSTFDEADPKKETEAAQERVRKVLQAEGHDIADLSFNTDPDSFIRDILKRDRAAQARKIEAARKSEDEDRKKNSADTSRGGGGGNPLDDLTKVNPSELISRGIQARTRSER